MNIFEDKNFIIELNNTLQNGGVIAFVTDTVWGIGCLPTNKQGVEKIYQLKNRDKTKPLILMSNTIENLRPYVNHIPHKAQELIDKHFPGALTIVLEKSDRTPTYITSEMNTVGIRIPNNIFFQNLCKHIDGCVLATTSANHSNQPAAKSYEETVEYLNSDINIILQDYGHTCAGLESTVALATNYDIKILRQGALSI